MSLTKWEPAGELPEGCKINGVVTFVGFLDDEQNEYFVPIWNVPDSDELKEAVLRNKVNELLKEAGDNYAMVNRIFNTLGSCFV